MQVPRTKEGSFIFSNPDAMQCRIGCSVRLSSLNIDVFAFQMDRSIKAQRTASASCFVILSILTRASVRCSNTVEDINDPNHSFGVTDASTAGTMCTPLRRLRKDPSATMRADAAHRCHPLVESSSQHDDLLLLRLLQLHVFYFEETQYDGMKRMVVSREVHRELWIPLISYFHTISLHFRVAISVWVQPYIMNLDSQIRHRTALHIICQVEALHWHRVWRQLKRLNIATRASLAAIVGQCQHFEKLASDCEKYHPKVAICLIFVFHSCPGVGQCMPLPEWPGVWGIRKWSF